MKEVKELVALWTLSGQARVRAHEGKRTKGGFQVTLLYCFFSVLLSCEAIACRNARAIYKTQVMKHVMEADEMALRNIV